MFLSVTGFHKHTLPVINNCRWSHGSSVADDTSACTYWRREADNRTVLALPANFTDLWQVRVSGEFSMRSAQHLRASLMGPMRAHGCQQLVRMRREGLCPAQYKPQSCLGLAFIRTA